MQSEAYSLSVPRSPPVAKGAARSSSLPSLAVPRHVAVAQELAISVQRAEDAAGFVEALRESVSVCLEAGVGCFSLLVSGQEACANGLREAVYKELARCLCAEKDAFDSLGVRLSLIGTDEAAERWLAGAIAAAGKRLHRERLRVNLAVNYNGRAEVAAAAQASAAEAAQGRLKVDALDIAYLLQKLPSGDLPPVDFLIHTASVRRLADFLLWKIAYAELLFMDVPWPAFRGPHLKLALKDYAQRRRTFGALP